MPEKPNNDDDDNKDSNHNGNNNKNSESNSSSSSSSSNGTTHKTQYPEIFPKSKYIVCTGEKGDDDNKKTTSIDICISNTKYNYYLNLIYTAKCLTGEDLLHFMMGQSVRDISVLLKDTGITQNLRDLFLKNAFSTSLGNGRGCIGRRIPRPLNAFMLYKQYHIRQLQSSSLLYTKCHHQNLNQWIGELWKMEKAEIIEMYRYQQEIYKIIHQHMYVSFFFY